MLKNNIPNYFKIKLTIVNMKIQEKYKLSIV